MITITSTTAHIAAASARFERGGICYYVKPNGETLDALHRKLRLAGRGRGWRYFRYGDAIGIKPKGKQTVSKLSQRG